MKRLAWLLQGVTSLAAGSATAQTARINGTSWVQSIDLRPLVRDSIPLAGTTLTDGGRRDASGRLVSCIDGESHCFFLRGGARETTRPFLNDLSIAAWGLGRGVSVHGSMRVRSDLGATGRAWPRVSDRFDALEAFVEVDRERVRVRAGRQWALNALGAYNYDGGSVLLRRDRATLEGYGGRALVQGLNEPYVTAEIGAVDDLPPDEPAALLGVRGRLRLPGDVAASGVYQRVVRRDRASLYAERFALDVSGRALGTLLSAHWAHDVAANTVNEARVQATRRVRPRLDLSVDARRSRPFFELWTIWGAFAPVGFDEGRAALHWRMADDRGSLSVGGGHRRYAAAGVGLDYVPLRSDGWRASADAAWTPGERWSVTASYGLDIGVGASQSDASLGARWTPTDRLEVGLSALGLQSIYEFRVGTGRVLGLAASGALVLQDDLRLRFDAGAYRHRLTKDAPGPDWSQRRASVRLEWAVGPDPGASR